MFDVAGTSRWRPVRAGIRNIWEYDDQVFEFADGRLVLRGPNGSGKSNALALLVPFLLDGVMAAHRMDSLSGGRSMKTLLLCLSEDDRAKRFRHDQRTGYVWVEFEKANEHLSIGCGARASLQRDAEAWFFVTSRRPGIDLDLAPNGVPMSKGALSDELGPSTVYDSADGYRAGCVGARHGPKGYLSFRTLSGSPDAATVNGRAVPRTAFSPARTGRNSAGPVTLGSRPLRSHPVRRGSR